jgi:hypothetical protein
MNGAASLHLNLGLKNGVGINQKLFISKPAIIKYTRNQF